ncbi:DegT/DnrJ/EryC1/StrS family aminotransferase [Thermodesulfobacteriota bacterium]
MDNKHSQIDNQIPHSRPTLGPEEVELSVAAIRSAQIAQGKMVQKFEQAFAGRVGVGQASATSSGTAALHVTLLAMGVGAKDEVIIPSYVCTALLNAVRYVGATPILADIDPETKNLDPNDVKERLTRRTKVVIVPHLFGLAADMDEFMGLDVPIIEDCAQSVGGTYGGKRLGSFGRAAIFSFYATKVMTTGEGGMVVSNSEELIERVKDLREYDEKNDYKIRYNYKMTNIHAAMGIAQLAKLDAFIQRRRSIAKQYYQALEGFGLRLPPKDPGHIYFRYVIGLEYDSAVLIQNLRTKGVRCAKPVYRPLHRYLYQKGYPQTEKAWRQAISIPIYPSLSSRDTDRVIRAFMAAHKGNGL